MKKKEKTKKLEKTKTNKKRNLALFIFLNL